MPEAADSVSHGWVLLAVQLKVPAPVLVMFKVCPVGFAAPAVAVKLALAADTLKFDSAVTTKVTPMVFGVPMAPGAAMVAVSV